MEKNLIFKQRKELKKRSHQVVRGHYFLLTFLIIVMAFFGTEFKMAKDGLSNDSRQFLSHLTDENGSDEAGGEPKMEENPGSILEEGDVFDSDSILTEIMAGNLQRGNEMADELDAQIAENGDDSRMLGRTRGIMAGLVNSLASGKLMVKIAQGIRAITHSDAAAGVVVALVTLLVIVFSYIFIKNVYSAAMRRLFLEARIYEKVSFLDALHFVAVKRWIRASLTMFLQYVFQILWSFTIVGGIIKSFSYFAVPYIVAENPDIRPREAITLSRRMMDGHKW